jgi:hypothetical protein
LQTIRAESIRGRRVLLIQLFTFTCASCLSTHSHLALTPVLKRDFLLLLNHHTSITSTRSLSDDSTTMDSNIHPKHMETDGAVELPHGSGTVKLDYPTSSVPESQSALPDSSQSSGAASFVPGYQSCGSGYDVTRAYDPPALVPGPLSADASTLPVLSHLQSLLDTYVASYNDDATLNTTRMEHAKALALALLQHYYPIHEGFLIQPSALGPMTRHGINFMLKADDGSSPSFTDLPPKKGSKKTKRKLTKAQTEKQRLAEVHKRFIHYWPLVTSLKWHTIEPDDIAGFHVMKKAAVNDVDQGEYRPHTYLAILIDDLQTLPVFADTNDVQHGDILADLLSRTAQIRAGYGVLLFGTRFELYAFDNGDETRIGNGDSKEYVEGTVIIEEPTVTLCKGASGEDLVVDLRTMGLQAVEWMLREVEMRGVEYIRESMDAGDMEAGETADHGSQRTDDTVDGVEE